MKVKARTKRGPTSTLTILKDECLFGPAECRIVRDSDRDKVYSMKRYVIGGTQWQKNPQGSDGGDLHTVSTQ